MQTTLELSINAGFSLTVAFPAYPTQIIVLSPPRAAAFAFGPIQRALTERSLMFLIAE
jgi:hypothetical protein